MIRTTNSLKSTIQKIIAWMTIAILWVCMLSYASLAKIGIWQDEFCSFSPNTYTSLSQWQSRIWNWSPRPISEMLIAAYSILPTYFHDREVGPALVILYIIAALLAIIIPCWRSHKTVRFALLLMSTFLFSNFIIDKGSDAILYWPMGSAPYFIMLAAAAGFTWENIDNNKESSLTLWGSALLFLVAGLHENGALLVTLYTGILILLAVATGKISRQMLLNCAPPLCFALLILWRSSVARLGGWEGGGHHDLIQAIGIMLKGTPVLLKHLWFIIPFFLCFYLCTPIIIKEKFSLEKKLILLSWSIALLLTAGSIAFLVPYQFGWSLPPDGRYFNALSGFSTILAITLAFLLNDFFPSLPLISNAHKRLTVGLSAIFIFSLIVTILGIKEEVLPSIKVMSARQNLQKLNYDAGLASGDTLNWKTIPLDKNYYLQHVGLPGAGHYTMDQTHQDWQTPCIMRYFNKKTLNVTD